MCYSHADALWYGKNKNEFMHRLEKHFNSIFSNNCIIQLMCLGLSHERDVRQTLKAGLSVDTRWWFADDGSLFCSNTVATESSPVGWTKSNKKSVLSLMLLLIHLSSPFRFFHLTPADHSSFFFGLMRLKSETKNSREEITLAFVYFMPWTRNSLLLKLEIVKCLN